MNIPPLLWHQRALQEDMSQDIMTLSSERDLVKKQNWNKERVTCCCATVLSDDECNRKSQYMVVSGHHNSSIMALIHSTNFSVVVAWSLATSEGVQTQRLSRRRRRHSLLSPTVSSLVDTLTVLPEEPCQDHLIVHQAPQASFSIKLFELSLAVSFVSP